MRLSIGRFAILLLLLAHPAFAQKNVKHSNQVWMQYYNQTKVTDRFSLMTDGGFRWSDGKRLLYIARTGLGYQLKSETKITAGIASTGAYDDSGLIKFEIRPYQDIAFSMKVGKIQTQHRFRVEERFFKNVVNGEIIGGHDFNFRFRYQIGATIHLLNLSVKNENRQLLLNVSDEIFINGGNEILYNIFDKNRLVIGPILQLRKNLNVGLIYNFQFAQLNAPAAYTHDNVVWLTVRHQMDTSTKQL